MQVADAAKRSLKPSRLMLRAESPSLSPGDAADEIGTGAVIAPSLVAHHNKLTQSTNTEAGLREARAGQETVAGYQPEPPPTTYLGSLLAKGEKQVPPVWTPVSPTIRPIEILGKKGESSKSQYLRTAQEEVHIAKVRNWISSIAPRGKDKDAAQTLNAHSSTGTQPGRGTKAIDMDEALTVEGPFSLRNGLARLSLGPSMKPTPAPEKKETKVQLSRDWNVSGIGKYTPKDLEKGPLFGRFSGAKTSTLEGNAETNAFGPMTKELHAAVSETGSAKEGDSLPGVRETKVTGRLEQSAGQEDAKGQEPRGAKNAVVDSRREPRGIEPRGTDQSVQTNGRDGESDQIVKADSAAESSGQDGTSRPSPEEVSQMEGTYTW
ncbi:hypothetical protein HO173_013021 [Letharia columbiana]|uniref:Uncharacterized protein n=1 Tax=Letharia columbiana TaxID=112416 RepID=A0A8H6CK45_9LECA|nr:uncharacterized protein HO173_013021 [Letharia columbiana]KAF6224581.1 hypothetical protein HO173_013021 [Letharia columbiana]